MFIEFNRSIITCTTYIFVLKFFFFFAESMLLNSWWLNEYWMDLQGILWMVSLPVFITVCIFSDTFWIFWNSFGFKLFFIFFPKCFCLSGLDFFFFFQKIVSILHVVPEGILLAICHLFLVFYYTTSWFLH